MYQSKSMVLVLTGLLCLVALPALADRKIDETRPATQDCTFELENCAGEVIVTGWDRNEVKVTGMLGRGTEDYEFEGDEDDLMFRVILPEWKRNVKETFLDVHVPKGCRLRIETVSAQVEISEVTGVVYVRTVSGEILLEGQPTLVDASSVSGDITMEAPCEEMGLETVSGDIRIAEARGECSAESVSGDIHIDDGTVTRLDIETVSGSFVFEGALTKNARVEIEVHSGDIELLFDGEPDAEFDIETFSGHIRNEFGPDGERTNRYGPGKRLDFTIGDGSAEVRINTFSGTVRLEKR